MRLHYLHLPHYGPLRNLQCVFRQNTLLPGRFGAVNFVVGVNGSGKSSLLRALFHTFRCLERDEPPPFPITLAYTRRAGITPEAPAGTHDLLVLLDHSTDRKHATRLQVWRPSDGEARPDRSGVSAERRHLGKKKFAALSRDAATPQKGAELLASFRLEDWEHGLAALRETGSFKAPPGFQLQDDVPLDQWRGNNLLATARPFRVLGYTSGDTEPWRRLAEREFRESEMEPGWASEGGRRGERPVGWTPCAERPLKLKRVVAEELTSLLDRLARTGAATEEEERARAQALARDLKQRLRELAEANEHQPYRTPSTVLLESADLHLAGVALGVWHAAEELRECPTEGDRAALLTRLREAPDERSTPAARLFNHLDWAWPTHLCLVVNPAAEPPVRDTENAVRMFGLHALASAVRWQPLGRRRLVIPLAARAHAKPLSERLSEHGGPKKEAFLANVDVAKTGAEAVTRLFSKEGQLWPLFEALRAWKESGWLEQATLIVLRIAPTKNQQGAADQTVICLEDFSDGERELLGRTALLALMNLQTNSLLLLDEPETHFNDAWKREVVDFVDEQLLRSTPCQVLVSTHSSIVLTDVFNDEVTLFTRHPATGAILADQLGARSFSASPTEIMREVFGAADAVGKRAAEFMDLVLVVIGEPKLVAELWRELDAPEIEKSLKLLQLVLTVRNALQLSAESEERTRAKVLHLLRELRALAGNNTERKGEPRLADAVVALERRVGAGFYQFELRRRVRALSVFEPEPDTPAPSMNDVMKLLNVLHPDRPPEDTSSGATAGA